MKGIVPGILLFFALLAALFSLLGGESYSNMRNLERSLSIQREKNEILSNRVNSLREEVNGLHDDSRAIEKAARNELGMARPNELIFIFDKGKQQQKNESVE